MVDPAPSPQKELPGAGLAGEVRTEEEGKVSVIDKTDNSENIVPFQPLSRNPSSFWAIFSDAPDSSKPFLSYAPRYWAMGLPVIPLWPKKKNPALQSNWQQFGQRMPTAAERAAWLASHPEGNIGLPLGPASGLVALDIDTDNPDLIAAIEQVAGADLPWRRVGSKGYVTVFRYNGEKTFRIKDAEGATLCELLSMGTQIVIPPSVHPATGRAYSANVDIADAKHSGGLLSLPGDFEQRLRAALTAVGAVLSKSSSGGLVDLTAVAGKGGRDTQLTRVAGHFAHCIMAGQLTLADAITAIQGWVLAQVEQVPGDGIGEEKAVEKLIRMLTKDAEAAGGLPKGWDDGLTDEQREQFQFETTDRSIIKVIDGQLPRVVDLAEKALIDHKTPLYVRADNIVRTSKVKFDGFHGKVIEATRFISVRVPNMVEHMTMAACFQKYDARSSRWKPIDCPLNVANTYLSRVGDWKLPTIRGILNAPSLRADGSVLDAPGYDLETQLLYEPSEQFGSVPLDPTREDALVSLENLKRLIQEFPFVAAADRAVALSFILTCAIRGSLPTAPLHGFTAPTAGTGKTKLVDIASVIATGTCAPVMAQGKTEEELEKRLFSRFLAGDQCIAIDNCEEPLGGEYLCQALTSPTVKGRILGKSETPDVSTNAGVSATGNGLRVVGDMTRRTVMCRLDAGTERPELREFGFEPVDLAKAGRARLVIDALTILRAYHVAGYPNAGRPLGSFTEWSRRVRDALTWLGEADACSTMESVRADDPKLESLSTILQQWYEAFGDEKKTVNEVITYATEYSNPYGPAPYKFLRPEFRESLLIVGEKASGQINSNRLGKWLASSANRIVDGLKFEKCPETRTGKVTVWRVRPST